MKTAENLKQITRNRRNFIKNLSAGTGGLVLGMICKTSESYAKSAKQVQPGKSTVSFTASKDAREASYQALKPLEKEIEKAIGKKQVVIKINSGQVSPKLWLNATDVNSVRGILDFLKPVYDKKVIIAESTAASPQTTMAAFENYNYMPLLKEYNIKFTDLNTVTYKTKWILDENNHPFPINIIDTYLDPDVYLISATRLKTHDCVIATLSLKNIVMGSPVNHYNQNNARSRNEKPFMHNGGNKGLSYNIFLLANMGVRPSLAVLDGVIGMEGEGPVSGTPVEQGVALASTDWLAADRLGVELMGIDYNDVKYLQWCAAAGMGKDNLSDINVIGPDYTKHIIKYKPNPNIDEQHEWIEKDYGKSK